MIRADHLVVSRPMYAFDPSTCEARAYGGVLVGVVVRAAWFRRKKGLLVATVGTYHPMVLRRDQWPTDGTYEAWIAAADDNRYGGSHIASWDGEALLNSDQPVTQGVAAVRVRFLDAMLRGFPEPPAGFDGWWTFARTGRSEEQR